MDIGTDVYGVFRSGQQAHIRCGEVVSSRNEDFTVMYSTYFCWTYNRRDIGRHVFLTEDEANEAVERFYRNVKMGFYD